MNKRVYVIALVLWAVLSFILNLPSRIWFPMFYSQVWQESHCSLSAQLLWLSYSPYPYPFLSLFGRCQKNRIRQLLLFQKKIIHNHFRATPQSDR